MSIILIKNIHFYLDPGSGSLIAQLLAGGFLAAGVLIRVFWQQIKTFFTKIGKKGVNNPDNDNQP